MGTNTALVLGTFYKDYKGDKFTYSASGWDFRRDGGPPSAGKGRTVDSYVSTIKKHCNQLGPQGGAEFAEDDGSGGLGYWASGTVDRHLQLGLGLGVTTLASGKSLSYSSTLDHPGYDASLRAGAARRVTITTSAYDVPAFEGCRSVHATCKVDGTEFSVVRISAGDKAENKFEGRNVGVATNDFACRGEIAGTNPVVAIWNRYGEGTKTYATAAESGATMEAF